jgi:aspartate kinase
MKRIVMKFGGTSVEDASAMTRVEGIVLDQRCPEPIVVLSAAARVTNQLIQSGELASQGQEAAARDLLTGLRGRHKKIAADLLPSSICGRIHTLIDSWFDELTDLTHGIAILGEATPRSFDLLASFGERLSTLIFHAHLQAQGHAAELVDARAFMITDSQYMHAVPDLQVTQKKLEELVVPILRRGAIVVTQGFIGSTPPGITTTIGRGGSDHSAALIGSLLDADEIQIWTDVDGILTADPSVVPTAHRIKVMSFMEASELAYFGARVLHPETIVPAIRKNIPVRVLNSRRPESRGTTIIAQSDRTGQCIVKSIAYKEDITLISIVSTRMFLAYGFLENVFDVFHKYRTVVHTVATSDISVSATINDTGRLNEIIEELGKFATVTVAQAKAIICVVGDNLRNSVGIAARVLHAVNGVNVNMISQGASEINISFVVDEDNLDHVVRMLHEEFFNPKDIDKEIFD